MANNNNADAPADKPIAEEEAQHYKPKYQRYHKKGIKAAVPASKKAMKPLKRASSKPKYKRAVPASKRIKS